MIYIILFFFVYGGLIFFIEREGAGRWLVATLIVVLTATQLGVIGGGGARAASAIIADPVRPMFRGLAHWKEEIFLTLLHCFSFLSYTSNALC